MSSPDEALPWSAILNEREITVRRSDRQRKELTGIEELASSILRRGQLQPVVVTRDHVLVAGERRLTAIRHAKLRQVKVVYSDEVRPSELQALELEENIKRVDLPWKDNCEAVARYHDLRSADDTDWTMAKTASYLGLSPAEVSQRIAVAKELRIGNPLVVAAPKLSTAKGVVSRQIERREAAETSQLVSLITPKSISKGIVPPETKPSGSGYILNTDFLTWAETYDGPRFNLIHCDFPYGVGMHKSEQGSGASYGKYADTPEIYWNLLGGFMANLDRFCEDSAHLIFWFSMDYYEETRRKLGDLLNADGTERRNPWKVNRFPLVWWKSDGSGILPDPNRGPRRNYETAFFAARGDRKIVKPVANAIDSPIQRGRHMSEKPQRVLRHFFRMLVDSHSSLLDPTCGSGSAIRAAIASGAGRYLGLEINKDFADHADELVREQINNPQTDLEDILAEVETTDEN